MKGFWGLITITLLCILEGAETDLFVPSLPKMQDEFSLSAFLVELMLSVNFTACCVASLIVGALGDRHGRKLVMSYGLLLFTIGGLICIFAKSYSLIIFGRFLQGIGIAAPSVLSYVVVADTWEGEKAIRATTLLNVAVTFAMALAPIIGSYISLYFGWRSNFSVLLGMGLFCHTMLYFFVTESSKPKEVHRSKGLLLEYYTLARSKTILLFTIAMCFCSTPYWVFIGMAPILYIKGLSMTMLDFGYYQGTPIAAYCLTSLLCATLLKAVRQKVVTVVALWISALSAVSIFLLAFTSSKNPILITASMTLLSIGTAFPVNAVYYKALEIFQNAKGKVAAIMMSIRFITTAIGIEIAGYFYDGTFKNIGYVVAASFFIGIITTYIVLLGKEAQLLKVDKV